jgi:predicted nucleic acid-binding protein
MTPGIVRQWREWRDMRMHLAAPRLIRYEVTNALHQLIRRREIDQHVANAALRTLLEMPIALYHEVALHQTALTYAVRFNIKATYDAHYLALAEHLSCELWTGDKRLHNSVGHHLPWVQLRSDQS